MLSDLVKNKRGVPGRTKHQQAGKDEATSASSIDIRASLFHSCLALPISASSSTQVVVDVAFPCSFST